MTNRLTAIIERWQAWADQNNVSFTPGMDKTDGFAESMTTDQLEADHALLLGILTGGTWASYDEAQQAIHDRMLLAALRFSMDTELQARKPPKPPPYDHLYQAGMTRADLAETIHRSNPTVCATVGCQCYMLADNVLAHYGKHHRPGALSFTTDRGQLSVAHQAGALSTPESDAQPPEDAPRSDDRG